MSALEPLEPEYTFNSNLNLKMSSKQRKASDDPILRLQTCQERESYGSQEDQIRDITGEVTLGLIRDVEPGQSWGKGNDVHAFSTYMVHAHTYLVNENTQLIP